MKRPIIPRVRLISESQHAPGRWMSKASWLGRTVFMTAYGRWASRWLSLRYVIKAVLGRSRRWGRR